MMMGKSLIHAFGVFMLLSSTSAWSYCFESAGREFNVDPLLILAVTIQETGLKPDSIGINRDASGNIKSEDYGLMQINSTHLEWLNAMGITKKDLINNPCLNVYIGTSILRKGINRWGLSWRAIGAYNAGFGKNSTNARNLYARNVSNIYSRLVALNKKQPVINAVKP